MATVEEILREQELKRQLEAGQAFGQPATKAPTELEPAAPTGDQLLENLQRRIDETAPTGPPRLGAGTPADRAIDNLSARIARQATVEGRPWGSPVGLVQGLATGAQEMAGSLLGVGTSLLSATPQNISQRVSEFTTGAPQGPDPRVAATALLSSLGVDPNGPPPGETIFEQIGRDAVPAAVFAASIIWGAPAAAQLTRSAVAQRVLPQRALDLIERGATSVATRPVTFMNEMLTGQVGATISRVLFEPYRPESLGPWGRFAWDFATELPGAIPAGGLGRRLLPVPRAERFNPLTTPGAPIIPPDASPELAGGLARVQAIRTQDIFDRLIVAALNRAGPNLSPEQAGAPLRGALLAARDLAKNTADELYASIPTNATAGHPSEFILEVQAQLSRAASHPTEAPNFDVEQLNRALRQYTRPVLNPDGTPALNADGTPRIMVLRPTVHDLLATRTTLDRLSRAAAETSTVGAQDKRILQASLDNLVEALTLDIRRGLDHASPSMQAQWELANEVYRLYNERFRRKPVGQLLMTTRHVPLPTAQSEYRTGTALVPNVMLAKQMLNADETAQGVLEAAQRVGLDYAQDPAIANAIRAGVIQRGEDAVLAIFRRDLKRAWDDIQGASVKPAGASDIPTTYNLNPNAARQVSEKARRFFEENEPLLQNWARLTSNMMGTVGRLNRLALARDKFTTSTISQFIGQPIERVITQAMATPNRAHRFQQLYQQFRGNDDMLEGLRRAMINQVFAGHGVSPSVALTRLNSPEFAEPLRAVFRGAEDRLQRLYDMVRATSQIVGDAVNTTAAGRAYLDERGTIQGLSRTERFKRGASIWAAGALIGLPGGHLIARMIPGMGSAGTLSIPMRTSTYMRNLVASRWLEDRVYSLSILRDAVFDPRLEAHLMNAMPGNWTEAQRQFERIGRWARGAERAVNHDVDEYLNQHSRPALLRAIEAQRELDAQTLKGPFGG